MELLTLQSSLVSDNLRYYRQRSAYHRDTLIPLPFISRLQDKCRVYA